MGIIFIRFIFQRITDIILKEKNHQKSSELISLLLSYLEYHFPSWKNNKYYLNNFKHSDIPDRLYCLGTNYYLKRHDIKVENISEEEVLKRYKKYNN